MALDGGYSSSGSDYNVEDFINAKRVRKAVNDDSADLLGNFDDVKRKQILDGTYEESQNKNASGSEEDEEVFDFDVSKHDEQLKKTSKGNHPDSDSNSDDSTEDNDSNSEVNTNLTKEQLTSLLRGSSKTNRHVLYVTNLNFETSKEDLVAYFSRAGNVKSVRVPKKRRGGFAFVEMADIDGFQQGFQLHNTELQGRNIKVQISEAGKKKSANKKNILKQKNRKLAEMRNEQKTFTKSGKFFDKALKKEKAKEILARKRWRKKPAGPPRT